MTREEMRREESPLIPRGEGRTQEGRIGEKGVQ